MTGTLGGYVVITIDENKQTDCLYILLDSPVLNAATKVFRWNEEGLCYTSGGIETGTWVKILDANGKINVEFLSGIITDSAGKNSWNLTSGEVNLSADTSFDGKTIATLVGELMPDVDGALETAINTYDTSLDQEKVLGKLQGESDVGLYLGEDGLLHMLPERVITDGLNASVVYLPTTIVDGEVTSSVQARVVNGIIYAPISTEKEET